MKTCATNRCLLAEDFPCGFVTAMRSRALTRTTCIVLEFLLVLLLVGPLRAQTLDQTAIDRLPNVEFASESPALPPKNTTTGVTNESRGRLDRAQWFATRGSWKDNFGEGKPFDASGIAVDDGVLSLNADQTDQVGVLYSKPIAVPPGSTVVIRRHVLVHAANRKFEGGLTAFGVADTALSASKPAINQCLFYIGYRNFDYETDQNLFTLTDGKVYPRGPGKFAGGTAPTTEPLWDQWFDEEIRYNARTGETVYSINGQERLRLKARPLDQPYLKFLLHPYGWYTGHYIWMRDFQITIEPSQAEPKSNADLRSLLLGTIYTWADNGATLGTIVFAPDGSARASWSGDTHYWQVDRQGDLVISAIGTTYVTRLKYVPGDGSFNGVRDQTSQIQDGVKSVIQPVGNSNTNQPGNGSEKMWDHTAPLSVGWDIFGAPLASGQVRWNIHNGSAGQKHFVVSYELYGAEPNHRYTAGAHFFEPVGQSLPEIKQFGGWYVTGKGGLSRDNVSAVVLAAWDFGTLTTNERGNGSVHFEYDIPATGSYYTQLTVRAGECRPGQGITSGCSVVYRTGRRMGDGFEEITGTDATNPPGGGSVGSGLRGEYYDNRELRGPVKFTRVDPSINFDWGYGSPGQSVPIDNFDVRWTGQIQPQFSEAYVFTGNRDNGFRLWIDGQLIVDLWNNEWGAYESRPITLQANRRYDIKVDYYEDWGGAAVSLKWKSPRQAEEIVPARCLFPVTTGNAKNGDATDERRGNQAGQQETRALSDFFQLMADGKEDQAAAFTTERFRQASADEKRFVREIVSRIAEAEATGLRVSEVRSGVAHVIISLKLAGGKAAVLFAEFSENRLNRLEWREHP